ncbi:MAG: gamma-glutamyl-gamma-aminobutyrate hydrolase family protein [Rhizomicrobium sp.]|nr:gamma-glutamyl-gamma-aminobutyrate hydrolase family protein [Rhizomicrobium sp.]
MKIAVTQRVITDPNTHERRDALDQRWSALLAQAGLIALPVPNNPSLLEAFLAETQPGGILLTGGNDLAALGGDAPERDAVESALLRYALDRDLPLLGVCRGMQMIQAHYGVPLKRVQGHVCPRQTIRFADGDITVNSFHNFGATETVAALLVTGSAEDGVIKAIRSPRGRLHGIMWHPERIEPPRPEDIALLHDIYGRAP